MCDLVTFHPYNPWIIMANQASGTLTVWDTARLEQIASFHNHGSSSPAHGRITSLRLINPEEENTLLAVGTSDGVIRLWERWWTAAPECLTAWKALSKLRDSRDGLGERAS